MVDHTVKLQMKLSESDFPFSRRMSNFFQHVGLSTVADLIQIPLDAFTCFRGFKTKCKSELIAFIEFERLQELFEGFKEWTEASKV